MTIPVDISDGDKSADHILNAAKLYKHPPKIATRQEREQLVAVITEELMQKSHFATLLDNMQLRYYKDGIYVNGADGMIHAYIVERLRHQLKNSDRKEAIEHIRHRNHAERSDFDAEPDILNVKNGLLDVNSGKLRPHDPGYLSIAQVPRWYCPYCSCPRFSRFLLQVLESKEKVREAVKLLGYMLHSGMEYEKSFMFVGNGANGKGTFINVIEAFFGSENCSSESLHDLVSEKFSREQLFGKFVNIYADLEARRLPATGMFKMLTSGDLVSAQFKYGQLFKMRNRAKIVYSANNPPISEDNTYAYFRRWVIFAFDKTFAQNPKLLSELTTERELSGILNLALKGWRWLVEDGGFMDESVEKIRQDYEYRANNVKRFVDDMCMVDFRDPKYFTTTDRLYNSYEDYCKQQKLRPLESNVFGAALREMGIVNKQKSVKRVRDTYYVGIVLRSDMLKESETLG